MKKILILLTLALGMATIMLAQEGDKGEATAISLPAKYCMTLADYQSDRWTDAGTLERETRSDGAKLWSGGGDYKFTSSDEALTKLLKKEALVIRFRDSLFVNVGRFKHKGAVFGKGYNLAYAYKDGKLLFLAAYTSRGKNMSLGLAGGLGGAVGGAIAGSAMIESGWANKVCYLVESDGKEVTCLDQDIMPAILAAHPNLLAKYNAIDGRKERRKAIHVMPLLIEAGIVKTSSGEASIDKADTTACATSQP